VAALPPPIKDAWEALILTPDFPPAPGGIQLLVHRLAVNFQRIEPRVVALGVKGDEAFDADAGIPVVRVGRKGGRGHRAAVVGLNLAGLAVGLRRRPDIVLCGHVVTAPAAALLRRRGARVVQYLHGDEFRNRPELVRWAMKRADAVVAVSRHTRDMALGAGCDARRLHVIPPGVDLPGKPVVERAERPTVITVARLVEAYKGHDVMIRAIREARERVPGLRWVVVGDGPLRAGLETIAREEQTADAIEFLGSISNAERDRRYDEAHVFAMPSRLPPEGVGGEGFGIVYLEAGAHGLPSVAGDVAGARDAVVADKTGRLVDPTDPEIVADALTDLLLDRAVAEEMGAAARRYAREHAWPKIAERVEALCMGLLSA
jgi:phosphatidylinositol alpha-1,6-mannosyltransferase